MRARLCAGLRLHLNAFGLLHLHFLGLSLQLALQGLKRLLHRQLLSGEVGLHLLLAPDLLLDLRVGDEEGLLVFRGRRLDNAVAVAEFLEGSLLSLLRPHVGKQQIKVTDRSQKLVLILSRLHRLLLAGVAWFGDIEHTFDELLGVLDARIDLVLLDDLCVLVKVAAVHFCNLALQLILLLAEKIVACDDILLDEIVHVPQLLVVPRANRNIVGLASALTGLADRPRWPCLILTVQLGKRGGVEHSRRHARLGRPRPDALKCLRLRDHRLGAGEAPLLVLGGEDAPLTSRAAAARVFFLDGGEASCLIPRLLLLLFLAQDGAMLRL